MRYGARDTKQGTQIQQQAQGSRKEVKPKKSKASPTPDDVGDHRSESNQEEVSEKEAIHREDVNEDENSDPENDSSNQEEGSENEDIDQEEGSENEDIDQEEGSENEGSNDEEGSDQDVPMQSVNGMGAKQGHSKQTKVPPVKSKGKPKPSNPTKTKRIPVHQRLGLTFPVGRIHRYLKHGRFARRTGMSAPVYVAATLDYMVAELIDIAAISAAQKKKPTIKPVHIVQSINEDSSFKKLLGDVTIRQGGRGGIVNIHPALSRNRSSNKAPKNNTRAPETHGDMEDDDLLDKDSVLRAMQEHRSISECSFGPDESQEF